MKLKIALAAATLLASTTVTSTANAQQTDAAGVFLPTYLGPQNADVDIISSQAFFDGTRLAFTATMRGAIGTTPGANYVFGLNRGAGTSNFANIGNPNVVFDATVLLRPGVGALVTGSLIPDFFYVNGNTISAVVPINFLPSLGLEPEDWKWSLWSRGLAPNGTQSIADFGPDNSTVSLTLGEIPDSVFVTPEPASFAMVGIGMLGVLAAARRRTRSA